MQRNDRHVLVELRFESTLCDMDGEALLRLAREAWRNNIVSGVTGEMRVQGGRVRQVIEGPVDAVLPLAARILGDRRHTAIELTAFGYLEARRHSDWRVHGLPSEPSGGRVCREAPAGPAKAASAGVARLSARVRTA